MFEVIFSTRQDYLHRHWTEIYKLTCNFSEPEIFNANKVHTSR